MTRALALTALLGLAACGEKQDPISPSCDIQEAVSYNGQVAALFDEHCTRCHSATAANRHGAPSGVNFDTFAGASANSEFANARVQAGTMPPADSVPRADRCVFQAWVDQGATEN